MEDRIENALKELLEKQSKVVFPGFGAFVAIDMPAMIDSQSNLIFPPRRKVNYDPSITDDDGLLIKHYAQQERISRESASEQIHEFVEEVKHRLQRGKSWVVEDLGKFIIDGMNNLIFFPDPDQNFVRTSYGLPEIEVSLPEAIAQEPILPQEKQEKKGKKHALKMEKAPKVKKQGGSKVLLTAAVFLILIAGGAYAFLFQTTKGKELMAGFLGAKNSHHEAEPAKAEEHKEEASAKVEEAKADDAEKHEEAKKEVSQTAQYTARTSTPLFEIPERVVIEPTGLDQFVKAKKQVAEVKPVVKPSVEKKAIAVKEETKTKVASVSPVAKKGTKSTTATKPKESSKEPASSAPAPSQKATKSYGNVYAKYQVVASSHFEIDLALKDSEAYRKRGYNSAVLNFPDGSFKVCIGRSESEDGAQNLMSTLRKETGAALSVQKY